ncbi:F-box associated interaction domain [Arabidopsis thaliana x Arabidopsis arenosa]|uniref:F-box associated interaction domain n=1 Tax=Arabidopsis thaliana x Arabidopsis arenosa TaxID=1240361 RepID=A0A8T1XH95_9BRAS|nr:F-box associated interaction domain [Arabidopsis thaliana x Arabidopsis arenosa]
MIRMEEEEEENPKMIRMEEEEEETPNPVYINEDLVEDILLRLPLKTILKFKTVSKQWRSILESKSFVERRKSVQKNPKILAVGELRFQGDAEIDVVYLQCHDATTRPSLTCDGLVCIPVTDWVNVLNPSTGEFLRFPSGPSHYGNQLFTGEVWWSEVFPGYWAMGFGRDEVKGSYKVVRMLYEFNYFEILDVDIGEWRKLTPPPYKIEATRKSACVNGSIYWLNLMHRFKILALDLHTEEFRDVPVLPPPRYTGGTRIVNLENRLAVTDTCFDPEWALEIWSMDAQEETWTMTYFIRLSHLISTPIFWRKWFTPMAVSKQGNLFFCDSEKRLFKYYPGTDYLCCLSPDFCVITPFVENLVSLRSQPGSVPKISTSGYQYGLSYLQPGCVPKISTSPHRSRVSNIVGRMELLFPNILLTSTLVSLIIFGYRYKYST